MKFSLVFATACLLVHSSIPAVSGDVVSIVSDKDNTLYEDSAGLLSNGAGDHFFASQTANGEIRRGLLHFDVAGAIPNGSTINNVTLTLNMSRAIGGDQDVNLHLALADWGEGTSDAPREEGGGTSATAGDATWIHTFFPGSLWTNPGGDFLAAASATQIVGGVGSYSWNSAVMVSDVQGWLDNGSSNFGWIVVGDESGFELAKRFDTRENPNQAFRPTLTIDFTPIPEPSMCLFCGLAIASLVTPRRRAR